MAATTTVLVTPEAAAEWIKLRHQNQRPVNKSRVDYYARQMRLGEWRQSNDAICFDHDGYLVNGLTRLSAVVASGCAVAFDVKFGMSAEDVLHIDDGRSRTARDTVRFASGSSNHNADVIRYMVAGTNVRSGSAVRVSPAELVRCYEACKESISACGTAAVGWTAAARAVCCLAHFCAKDDGVKAEIARFAEMARQIAEPAPGTPGGVTARALRTALARRRSSAGVGGAAAMAHWRLTQAALRAFLDGRELVLVRETEKEYWPALRYSGLGLFAGDGFKKG